ncbi:putative membrane protein [Pseudonocardia sulfidoxydans NBRC 16205]|uniref:Putative membrane protein n=1 Tax=Pseudonocardia sulfidoxydans NBRC 16205 TaxID=1223511 RepID=A0A511DQ64_9PSEU|nr:DedA family protein [Pseudonocardia sulfidoxydans]GEL26981.1 putative membrane protein [Pseudonocardia sulfidoxydans NBRC 16205]
MWLDDLLQTIPPLTVYLLVGLVVGIESLGIPLPGEIVLVSAALLSSHHELAVSPVWIAVAGSAGAILGDSIGYAVGRRYGMSLFDRLGRRFPAHFGPSHVQVAQRFFHRWGMWAVFFGRFVALLRIFSGPLAGAMRMHYPRFLVANALGGIVWATGTTLLVYSLGVVAEHWLSRFSWVALLVAVIAGIGVTLFVRRRTHRMAEAHAAQEKDGYYAAESDD